MDMKAESGSPQTSIAIAIERANACQDARWACWGYHPARQALILDAGVPPSESVRYLIFYHPTYIRLPGRRFDDVAKFATGHEALASMASPPPASILRAGTHIVLIRSGAEWCVVSEAVEYIEVKGDR